MTYGAKCLRESANGKGRDTWNCARELSDKLSPIRASDTTRQWATQLEVMISQQVSGDSRATCSWQSGCSSKDRYTINASDLHESPDLYSDHSSRGAFVLVSGALSWSMDRALTLRLLSGACSSRLRDESESPWGAWNHVSHLCVHSGRRP